MSTHEQRKEAAEKICTDLDGDVKHDIFYNWARSGFMLGCEWEAKSSKPTAIPQWDTMEWWRTEAKAWQALAIANANQCGHLGGQLEDAIKGNGYMPQAAYLTEKARADNLQAELEAAHDANTKSNIKYCELFRELEAALKRLEAAQERIDNMECERRDMETTMDLIKVNVRNGLNKSTASVLRVLDGDNEDDDSSNGGTA